MTVIQCTNNMNELLNYSQIVIEIKGCNTNTNTQRYIYIDKIEIKK